MKKSLCIFIALALFLGVAGCTGRQEPGAVDNEWTTSDAGTGDAGEKPANDTAKAPADTDPGTAIQPTGSGGVKAAVTAAYPEMPPYPEEKDYIQSDGSLSDEYFEAYDKWRDAQPAWAEKTEGFDAFYARCIAEMLSDSDTENRVCSPVNIAVALSMLAELTGSETRDQILGLLGADSVEQLRQRTSALWKNNFRNDATGTTLLANSIWLDDRYPYKTAPLDTLAQEYYASSYTGRMGSQELTAALRQWLSEQTGGLLDSQIQGIELTDDMILALCSTVYLSARWTHQFFNESTWEDVFHSPDGDVTREFMHEKSTQTYYHGQKFSSVCRSLDNVGDMWFILPDEGVDCGDLLEDGEAMEFMASDKGSVDSSFITVNLSVPKFDVCGDMDLTRVLQRMGVSDALDPSSADFSPLTDQDGVYVSQARHAARVKIDEEGCVAAAYNVMMAAGAALPPPDEVNFVLDRPFIFVITGVDGSPLFAGTVNMP
ncbi:MAG: hypothetical protein IKE62_03335 [Oscillospiraceae bacterium]|nr:hypothetical protein [Oscillospiraceae bacterium]